MFKHILVPVIGADTDAPVFATAIAVACLSGSHLYSPVGNIGDSGCLEE